ncbi:MAG: MFS transporter, partial [Candidatus Promineifilaceae bacterium]
YGARGIMTVGSICASFLFYAFSQVTTLRQLYLVWIGLGVTMASILYEPAFTVVAKWFTRKRSTALAIVTFAAGFASTIFLPLSNWLLETYGREQALIILTLILAIVTIPLHALVLRREPQDLGLGMDGDPLEPRTPAAVDKKAQDAGPLPKPDITWNQALRGQTFWWIVLAFATANMAGIAFKVHFLPLLIDRGYASDFAAWIAGFVGAAQVFGRVLYAPVGNKLPGKRIVMGLFVLQGAAFALLWLTDSLATLWVFVVLFGAAHGAITLARPAMIADVFGAAQFGRISAIMTVIQRFASTIAPYGAGFLYILFRNSYDPVLLILVAVSLLAVLAIRPIEQSGEEVIRER